MSAHAAKLMNSGKGADSRVIFDNDMSCQSCCIGENYSASNNAVVRDVHSGHQIVVVAKDCRSASAQRASIDRHKFPYEIVAADPQVCGFTFEFEVLRIRPD